MLKYRPCTFKRKNTFVFTLISNLPVLNPGWTPRLFKLRLSSILLFSLMGLSSLAQNNKVTAVTIPTTQTGSVFYGASSSATYVVTLTTDGGLSDGTSDLSLNL